MAFKRPPLRLQVTTLWGERRYLDLSLLKTKEVHRAA